MGQGVKLGLCTEAGQRRGCCGKEQFRQRTRGRERRADATGPTPQPSLQVDPGRTLLQSSTAAAPAHSTPGATPKARRPPEGRTAL